MRDIDYYRRQAEYYREVMEQEQYLSVERLLEMADMVITIHHRPDKLSPKKKMNEFRFK
jgi:hypothetical protein